jgi:curved DNA-binding protein CbpA
MTSKNISDAFSDDEINNLINTIEESKKDKHYKQINLDSVNMENYDQKTQKAIKDLSLLPDYYKILGVSPTDSNEKIKSIGMQKLSSLHPDKISTKLLKIPAGKERDSEKKKLEMQYKLVHEAFNELKNPDKRKFYDLQKKTINNKDFIGQKNSFESFIKLQDSEVTEHTKQSAGVKFIMSKDELNKRRNFREEDIKAPPLSKDEMNFKFTSLEAQRDAELNEYSHKNRFETKSFNLVDFNKNWDKMKKKEERRGKKNITDNTLVAWEGISAANDVGLTGNNEFISVDANYDDVFIENSNSKFAKVLDSENYSSDSDDSDYDFNNEDEFNNPDKYVSGHNLNRSKEDLNKRMIDFQTKRSIDIDIQETKKHTDKEYWNDVMNNPFSVSAQMGSVIGNDIKQLGLSKKSKYLSEDKIEAYKQLIYENDNTTKKDKKK